MTYLETLRELEQIGLKETFVNFYEELERKEVLKWVKSTDKIHSTASLIGSLIRKLKQDIEQCNYWVQVLHYFMTPVFARDLGKLPKI